MTLVTRSRPQIGDVIEILTPHGLAYAHYTHKHPSYGALIRVIHGMFDSRPEDFRKIVMLSLQFCTFFPLGAACNRGIVRVIANEPISAANREFPTFRASTKGRDGSWGDWWLWDGDKEWRIGKLKPGMAALPPRGVINDTLLVERIIGGWRHEHFS